MNPQFKIGDIVFFVTDEDNSPNMVVSITYYPNGYYYTVSHNGMAQTAYEIELRNYKNFDL